MTIEEAKFKLDVRNSTFRLSKKTKKCKTWQQIAEMLILEFCKD